MKVLIVHEPGGVIPESYPRALAEELWRLDCEVLLQEVAPADGSWASGRRLRTLAKRLLSTHDPELIHVIAAHPDVAHAFADRGTTVIHSTLDRPSASDWVVAPSRGALGRVRDLAPRLDYRTSCLPFGLDFGEPAIGVGSFVLARFAPEDEGARRWIEEAAAQIPEVPVCDEGDVRDARFLLYASSRPEPWPAGVAEAMAAGRPVIASWGGAASELVGEAVTGFLCRPGDACGLAGSMEYLWHHPGEALFMGLQAREEAKHLFGMEPHARSLLRLYLRAGASRLAVQATG